MRTVFTGIIISTLCACGADIDDRRSAEERYLYPSEPGIETEEETRRRKTDALVGIDTDADQRTRHRMADTTFDMSEEDDMTLMGEDQPEDPTSVTLPNTFESVEEPSADQESVAEEMTEEVMTEEEIAEEEATGQEPTEEELLVETGAVLYAENCASCHNVLFQSSKSDRSADAIQNALDTVGSMRNLGPFTVDEIDALAAALNFNDLP